MRPRKIILYVGGDDDVHSLRRYMLETMGPYLVETCFDAKEALAIFRFYEIVEMVITEFELPGEDGIKLTTQLRAESPYTPSIILGDWRKVLNRTHSASAFLSGHVSAGELLARIKVLIKRSPGPRIGSHHKVREAL